MFSARMVLVVCLSAGMGTVVAAEAVTREEFQKFVDQLQNLAAENAQIKAANVEIRAENADLKKEIAKVKPSAITEMVETELDKYVTLDEFKAIKDGVTASNPGTTKFLMTGSAVTTFTAPNNSSSQFTAEFDPIFLWKMSENLSFEAEVPITADGSVELEYADIAYVANDYLTIQAGKIKSPFGIYNMRFDPPWMNKLVDPPMISDDGADGIVPHEQVGLMGIGAVDAGPTKIRYAGFVSNGLQVDQSTPATYGQLIKANNADNNNNKGIGGRIGFLPMPCVELGASAEYSSNVFNKGGPGAFGRVLGLDLSMNRDFDELMGTIDFKAEFASSKVGANTYQLATATPSTAVVLNNRRSGSYAQMAYRPTKIDQKWVKNLEAAFRYDHLSNPKVSADMPPDALFQRQSHDRWTVGLNYYLEPSTVLKADFERDDHGARVFTLQYAIGF